MLDIQALKFARSMSRQVASNPLIVTPEWSTNWLRDLYDSFETAVDDGESTENFLKAEEEYIRARDEGRIIVRDPEGSDSSAG
jgi:hypothetical protein